jgi:hypothetical protein
MCLCLCRCLCVCEHMRLCLCLCLCACACACCLCLCLCLLPVPVPVPVSVPLPLPLPLLVCLFLFLFLCLCVHPLIFRVAGSLLSGLDSGTLRTQADEFWPTFEPKADSRVKLVCSVMKDTTAAKDTFLVGPLVRNTIKILEQVATVRVGAVVVGHKMSGKSQTLEFLVQFLRFVASKTKTKFYGFKVAFTTEGGNAPPQSYQEVFHLFHKHVFKVGALKACTALLTASLQRDSVFEPCSENAFLELCAEKYYQMEPLADAAVEEVAYMVLKYHRFCVQESDATGAVSLNNLQGLVTYGCELFKRVEAQKYLQGPCLFVFDEVGELFSPTQATRDSEAYRVWVNIFLPIMKNVSEQASSKTHSNLFVILSGSTSLAAYVEKQHLQDHVCALPGFSAEECQALWGLWRSNLKAKYDVQEAEKWMLDVAPAQGSEGDGGGDEKGEEGEGEGEGKDEMVEEGSGEPGLGGSLLEHSDGVAGCLTELFREAIGEEPQVKKTLAHMVKVHYLELKKDLTAREGDRGAPHVRHLMNNEEWLDFAQHGLAPSAELAPSAPVLRLLFALLQDEQGIDEAGKYGDMLRSLAALNLSGSYTGAVYQAQVLHAFLAGEGIYITAVTPPTGKGAQSGSKKTKAVAWASGEPSSVTWKDQRAVFVKYKKNGKLGDPLYTGPDIPGQQRSELLHQPTLVVFVAESQTFPSIDLSIAIFNRKDKTVVLYHSSVSIDAKHFAPSLKSKAGHLPLDITVNPPALLRSQRAKTQLANYKTAVLTHSLLKDMAIEHRYAVFDDSARDLLQPTPPFDQPYWIMSTKAQSNPHKTAKK